MTPEQNEKQAESAGSPNLPTKPTQTLGQRRVRAAFNQSQNSLVDEIKAKSAELIDLCAGRMGEMSQEKPRDYNEIVRLYALAMTHYEDAAMWAVKAATA